MENFKEKMQKSGMDTCNRWGIYEVALDGPKEGNPFTEQRVTGTFHSINETVSCDGFYDGDGIYRIRFMPSFEGEYTYQIQTTFGKEYEGHFTVIKPKENAHGPVRVANTYHMAYEDGTPYYSIGTTCYVWELQSDELIEQTFDTHSKTVHLIRSVSVFFRNTMIITCVSRAPTHMRVPLWIRVC